MQRYDCLNGQSILAADRAAREFNVPGSCGTCDGCQIRRLGSDESRPARPVTWTAQLRSPWDRNNWATVDWRLRGVLLGAILCTAFLLFGGVSDFRHHDPNEEVQTWAAGTVIPRVRSQFEARKHHKGSHHGGDDDDDDEETETETETQTEIVETICVTSSSSEARPGSGVMTKESTTKDSAEECRTTTRTLDPEENVGNRVQDSLIGYRKVLNFIGYLISDSSRSDTVEET